MDLLNEMQNSTVGIKGISLYFDIRVVKKGSKLTSFFWHGKNGSLNTSVLCDFLFQFFRLNLLCYIFPRKAIIEVVNRGARNLLTQTCHVTMETNVSMTQINERMVRCQGTLEH